MKKRLLALLLTLALLLSGTAAAATDSTENFVPTAQYSGQFSDLSPDNPHYANVVALYEYGLSAGRADGTYGASDPMLLSEALIFCDRLRCLYQTGNAEAGAEAHRTPGAVYLPYLHDLQAQGILGREWDGGYDKSATRAQLAYVLARTLPAGTVPLINEEAVTVGYATGRCIRDITDYTPYRTEILTLYKQGILVGCDATGSFRPGTAITRGEVAAMLTRLLVPALRLSPHWTEDSSARGTTMAGLIRDVPPELIPSPRTRNQMDANLRYMLAQDKNTITLHYDKLDDAGQSQLMTLALDCAKNHCEQMLNWVQSSYNPATGTLVLTFSAAGLTWEELQVLRTRTLSAASAVHDTLWESGVLHTGMSETEIARVYFTWLAENCAYEKRVGDFPPTHLADNVFHKHLAVCDGYTGAYNLLLKLEGIDCHTQSSPDHIWTVARLDGVDCHIDTTWGDTDRGIDYSYFAMTEARARTAHNW
ncbi:MAG: S-layer homology domain-containing protein [Oscillospiraceae bacterium]